MMQKGHENIISIRLRDNRKLSLFKGTGWKEHFLEAILSILNDTNTSNFERIRSSQGTRVFKSYIDENPVIIKFFKHRGIKDKLFLRKSRSRRAMEGGLLLSKKNFYAPSVIAQGEIKKGIWVDEDFLIMKWITENLDVYTYFKASFKPPLSADLLEKKRNFLKALGRLIGRLHKNGIYHGDLRLGNILMKNIDKDPVFYFIDNERNKYFPEGMPMRLRINNLIQANKVIMPQLTFTDRMRFLKWYLDENPEIYSAEKYLAKKVFLKTKKTLSKRISGIWDQRLK